MRHARRAGLIAAALLAGAARANDPGPGDIDAALPLSGTWSFEDTRDRPPAGCYVRLMPIGGYGQFDFWPGPGCKEAYGVLTDAAGWMPDGAGIRILSGLGPAIAALAPEPGHPEALYGEAGDGTPYRMERPFPRDFPGSYELWTQPSDFRGCRIHLGGVPMQYGFDALLATVCFKKHKLPTIIGWTVTGDGEGGLIVTFIDDKGAETGSFTQAEGAEDALYGTIDGVAYKLAKVID